MGKSKIKIKPKLSQWEIIEEGDDLQFYQDGGKFKDNLIKIDNEWYNQDIIDGLERGYRVEQRRWNSNLNRYGTVNEEEFYKKFPTEEHFILENQRRYANHIGSSRKYAPQDETLMQQGGQVRQPIKGTKEQYQAYQDSLDLYNYYKRVEDLAKANKQEEFRKEVKLTDKKALEASIRLSALNNNRPPSLDMQGESIKFGNTTMTYLKAKKPVQPIIYTPENERQNPLEQPQVPFPNTTNGQFNRTISEIRPKQTTIQIESKKADLLPTSPMNLEIERIPFAQGTYFTRDRQNQELDSKQFGRKVKKDYFDKKTGKLLGTYKNGGKISDWEIIFD